MHERPTILVIDDRWGRPDDPMIEETYGALRVRWVKETAAVPGGYAAGPAVEAIRRHKPAMILLDISFGPPDNRLGLDILEAVRADFPVLPVLVLTSLDSEGHREVVVRCMELGANEYVEKAPSPRRMQALISLYTDPASDLALYGNSASLRKLRAEIARVAFSAESSVLILGESGTGKELIARALHRQGHRSRGELVVKNCAGATEALDVELFGQEQSFPGAPHPRPGVIEEADGGVLFLDEIGDMGPELQGKLLRALDTREFRRVGGAREVRSRFQLVCATNRDVVELLESGRLREDFYYRISSVVLEAPPLRERADDIPMLVERFITLFRARGGSSYPGRRFAAPALASLRAYHWPGNIRELRNIVERALLMSRDSVIEVVDLPLASGAVRAAEAGSAAAPPGPPSSWSSARLRAELLLALEARRTIERYKGAQWKAEFMRLMYPEYKAANAKGFSDLVKRWTSAPWGDPNWENCEEVAQLLRQLTA